MHYEKQTAELHAKVEQLQSQVKTPPDDKKRDRDDGKFEMPQVKVEMTGAMSPPMRKTGVDVTQSPWKEIFPLAGVFCCFCLLFADFF